MKVRLGGRSAPGDDLRLRRNLIDILAGLAPGVGKYYGEALTVSKLSDTQLAVEWT